jgi:hypothetical protein
VLCRLFLSKFQLDARLLPGSGGSLKRRNGHEISRLSFATAISPRAIPP